MKTINITPDVSLLQKAGEVNYKIPHAIAELVDNAVDARIPGSKLNVEVTLGQKGGEKRIRVTDDGTGMDRDAAEKAMVMAFSDKDKGAIGEFGLGMKTASSFLGHRFEIVTATADARKALRLIYDEDEFLTAGEWLIAMDEVEKPFDRGTQIEIERLKVNLYAGVKGPVLEHFGRTFKHFVAAGEVEIVVNGDSAMPYIPDTIKDYDTDLSFDVNEKPVRGWVSLATKGSGRGWYGFDLVRHNRVLSEHEKLGFAASSATSRIIGELHLDDFPVVNNKTDFRRDTDDWAELQRQLEERLTDISRESRRMANPGKLAPKDEAEVNEYIDEVQEALKDEDLQADLDRRALDAELADDFAEGALPFEVPAADGSGEEPTASNGGHEDPTPSLSRHRLNRVKTQLRNLAIEHEVAQLGKESLYKIWEIQGVGRKKKLVVTTNSDHPMYSATQESFLLWTKHNIVEAVAEFFTEEAGKTTAMILIKSDILKHIGRMELRAAEDHSGLAPTSSESVEA